MRVTVTCLGMLAELASSEPVDLLDVHSVDDVFAALIAKFPAIEPFADSLALATHEAYLRFDDPLEDGMALLLVPPVSGG